MAIKDAEYYRKVQEEADLAVAITKFHIRRAEYWRDVFYATKDKRGLRWLNKLAYWRHNVHFREGMAVATAAFKKCTAEIDCLVDYLEKNT